MAKSLEAIVNDEAFSAVATVGGSFDEFVTWNYILAMYSLEPIDSFVAH